MRNVPLTGVALIVLMLGVIGGFPLALGQTALELVELEAGYTQGIREDIPTRRFVELYLRVAGGIWIIVEWTAAVFLVMGYRQLARWFALEETDRSA